MSKCINCEMESNHFKYLKCEVLMVIKMSVVAASAASHVLLVYMYCIVYVVGIIQRVHNLYLASSRNNEAFS